MERATLLSLHDEPTTKKVSARLVHPFASQVRRDQGILVNTRLVAERTFTSVQETVLEFDLVNTTYHQPRLAPINPFLKPAQKKLLALGSIPASLHWRSSFAG